MQHCADVRMHKSEGEIDRNFSQSAGHINFVNLTQKLNLVVIPFAYLKWNAFIMIFSRTMTFAAEQSQQGNMISRFIPYLITM